LIIFASGVKDLEQREFALSATYWRLWGSLCRVLLASLSPLCGRLGIQPLSSRQMKAKPDRRMDLSGKRCYKRDESFPLMLPQTSRRVTRSRRAKDFFSILIVLKRACLFRCTLCIYTSVIRIARRIFIQIELILLRL